MMCNVEAFNRVAYKNERAFITEYMEENANRQCRNIRVYTEDVLKTATSITYALNI